MSVAQVLPCGQQNRGLCFGNLRFCPPGAAHQSLRDPTCDSTHTHEAKEPAATAWQLSRMPAANRQLGSSTRFGQRATSGRISLFQGRARRGH